MSQAKLLSRYLYRDMSRNIPTIINQYGVSETKREVQDRIKECFMKNDHVTDPRVAEILLVKAAQDYEEFLDHYCTVDHFIEFMNPLEKKLKFKPTGDIRSDELNKFYRGIEN